MLSVPADLPTPIAELLWELREQADREREAPELDLPEEIADPELPQDLADPELLETSTMSSPGPDKKTFRKQMKTQNKEGDNSPDRQMSGCSDWVLSGQRRRRRSLSPTEPTQGPPHPQHQAGQPS